MNDVDTIIGLDGMPELDAEFVSNRVTQKPGMLMFVYCRDPAFDANYVHPMVGRRRRNVERCTSPHGIGPRAEPFDPPPVSITNKDHTY